MSNRTITAPKGFRAGSTACGLKASGNLDLGVLVCDVPAAAAACFTQNKVQAAPIHICREHLKGQFVRGLVVNSGCANACTGQRGLDDAAAMTRLLAGKIGCRPREVLVASTGHIGDLPDMDKIARGVDGAWAALGDDETAGMDFARAIMTTDTRPKVAYREFQLGEHAIRLAGVAKGAGMIAPNMATMLAFITTDARLSPSDLRVHLVQAVSRSFNRITVDGDMSTNDTVVVMASGLACDRELGAAWLSPFGEHLYELCNELALAIVADGEGATKVFHVVVTGGRSFQQARTIAKAIANSLLVKTAVHGGDPNWGRIIAAAGAAGVEFNPSTATCSLGEIEVFRHGTAVPADLRQLEEIMRAKDIWCTLNLGEGEASDIAHTCDLTKEYVDINSLYRT